MKRELTMEFIRVAEAAALASHKFIGCGDKNAADDAAVKAMRHLLNQTSISGEIVIGEGELDEAPMLHIGEKVGKGGQEVDIAVDPIDGTKLVAYGQANAVSTIMVCKKGEALNAPDMYMRKLVVGVRNVIDLSKTFEENLRNLSKALNKPLNKMTMVVLDRERHNPEINTAVSLGLKVFKFGDGDIIEAIKVFDPNSDIDLMYCIGGAPEGVIAAGIARAFDGDMQGQLVSYNDVYGEDWNANEISEKELKTCTEKGLVIGEVLTIDDLVKTDDIIFAASGITSGDLLEGVKINGNIAVTETMVIRGKTGTIRKVISTHNINKKDDYLYELITGEKK